MINKIDNCLHLVIEKIISTTTMLHPSKENTFLNLTIFEDDCKHPYLLIFESDEASFSVDIFDPYSYEAKAINIQIFLNAIGSNTKVTFVVFDLDYKSPKKMTKKEIEKELGYQIEIVE